MVHVGGMLLGVIAYGHASRSSCPFCISIFAILHRLRQTSCHTLSSVGFRTAPGLAVFRAVLSAHSVVTVAVLHVCVSVCVCIRQRTCVQVALHEWPVSRPDDSSLLPMLVTVLGWSPGF